MSWNLTERKSVKSCVIYPTKKQTFASLSRSRYCADRARNLPGPAPNNVLRVFQISSKSVHFRRSYIQTREHRQSELQSESNIRLKHIVSSRITITFITNSNTRYSFLFGVSKETEAASAEIFSSTQQWSHFIRLSGNKDVSNTQDRNYCCFTHRAI